jgi:hypothetical protein
VLGVNTDWLATGQGEKYSCKVKEDDAACNLSLIKRPPIIEEEEWKALPPQTRALFEVLLNKSSSGQLTDNHVKVLQNMVDVLIKN